jgi:His/Glu/Gln/Arg/opine family amino acid ABC transporter permease subunit
MRALTLRGSKASWLVQAAFIAVVVFLVWFLVTSTRSNLEAQGVTFGFGFLNRSTGWNVNYSLIPYTPTDPYWKVLVIGLMNTLWLGAIALTLATALGVLVAIARTVQNGVFNFIGLMFVETFRNVPILLQVFFWFAVFTNLPNPRNAIAYGDMVFLSARGIFVPGLNVTMGMAFLALAAVIAGIGVLIWVYNARRFRRIEPTARSRIALAVVAATVAAVLVLLYLGRGPGGGLLSIPARTGLNFSGGIQIGPEVSTMITAITIYGAAYISEIVRAGLISVGKGQLEAATALGLSPWQTFTRIRMALAFRTILPSLTNQYIWLIKATTLGIAVGFSDFFMVVAVSITQSGHTIELIAILMAGFLLINYTLAQVFNRINRAIALPGTRVGS